MIAKPKLNRRQFLRNTSTLAAAAPFLLPSRIWAAETKPNDRLTLGFIGMGTQNRGLLGGFLNRKETQTVAVCDVDTNRRNNARRMVTDFYAKQSGAGSSEGCAAYNDFRELLARKDIDAVVIATPDHWHALISIAAAKAGKDIYCEKPLCESIHEARAMVNAVRKNKRVFQTGSMQRSSKEFRVACELVRNEVIGRLLQIDVAVGGPGVPCDLPEEPIEPGLDWNLWLGPAPKRPYHSELSPRGVHKHFPNWRKYREYGGGMVTDWGAHHFDIAQWGLGMDESGPIEISPSQAPNATSGVKLMYANGVELTHTDQILEPINSAEKRPGEEGKTMRKSGNGIWFHGRDGKIYVNRGQFALYLDDRKRAESPKDCDAVAAEFLSKENAVHLYKSDDHKGDWLSCIRTRKPPICDVEVGARTVTVCHLVNLAYYHGYTLKWDPKREMFAGGTGRKEWLDVAYRSPWKLG